MTQKFNRMYLTRIRVNVQIVSFLQKFLTVQEILAVIHEKKQSTVF